MSEYVEVWTGKGEYFVSSEPSHVDFQFSWDYIEQSCGINQNSSESETHFCDAPQKMFRYGAKVNLKWRKFGNPNRTFLWITNEKTKF